MVDQATQDLQLLNRVKSKFFVDKVTGVLVTKGEGCFTLTKPEDVFDFVKAELRSAQFKIDTMENEEANFEKALKPADIRDDGEATG